MKALSLDPLGKVFSFYPLSFPLSFYPFSFFFSYPLLPFSRPLPIFSTCHGPPADFSPSWGLPLPLPPRVHLCVRPGPDRSHQAHICKANISHSKFQIYEWFLLFQRISKKFRKASCQNFIFKTRFKNSHWRSEGEMPHPLPRNSAEV